MAKLAPSATGWTGRTGLTPYTVDVAAWVAALPSYDDTGHDRPSYAEIMARIDKFAPVYPIMGGTDPLGYRGLFPAGMGTDTDLYGQHTAANIGAACLALISDSFSTAQKEAIATRLISQGIQWYDSYAGEAATGLDPNGGHFQFAFPLMAIALDATGRTAALAALRSTYGGNFKQYLAIDATLAAKFTPHDSMSDPFTWRRRNLDAISGTTFTLETRKSGDTGDATKFSVIGMTLTNGTASTTVTGLPGGENVASADPGQIDVTVADATGFSVDDTITFIPAVTPVAGQFAWSIHGNDAQFNPIPDASYRSTNQVSWAVLILKAAGIWNSEWDPVAGYIDAAARANYPAAGFDHPTPHGSFRAVGGTSYAWAADFWTDHAATIVAQTQVPGQMAAPAVTAVDDTSISVDRAAAPVDGGAAISSYDLRWRTGAGSWTIVTGISDPQTVGSLTAETAYEVQTRAVNANGAGPWSASDSATTDAAAVGGNLVPATVADFSDAAAWGVQTGMTVTGGVLALDGTNAANAVCSNTGNNFTPIEAGKTYAFAFDATRVATGGRFQFEHSIYDGPTIGDTYLVRTPRLGGSTVTVSSVATYGDGSASWQFTAPTGATHLRLFIKPIDAALDLDIDNISIVEV